jgi:hypothetical protein
MSIVLYFAGKQCEEAIEHIYKKGGHKLYSQYTERKDIESWKNKYLSKHNKLLIDSGAFTAHTKHKMINVDEYIDYINSFTSSDVYFVQLDHIPGIFGMPRTKEHVTESAEKSWENFVYMLDKVNCPDRLLPVFHLGEDLKYLDRILNTKFNGKYLDYIGFGGLSIRSNRDRDVHLERARRVVNSSKNPNVKVHAFGVTTFKLLEKYPFYSCDSSTWIQNSTMGSIITPKGGYVVSDTRIKDPAHVCNMPKAIYEGLEKYVNSLGFDLDKLRKDYKERLKFDIEYYINRSKKFKYNSDLGNKARFIMESVNV